MPPFSSLTDEQIMELLAEQPRIMSVPGVVLLWVDYVDSERTEIGVVASVYAGETGSIDQLPLEIAGLPVVVKVEDPQTMRVVEIIDPRENGGTWPDGNHKN